MPWASRKSTARRAPTGPFFALLGRDGFRIMMERIAT
jgi:hypothetical protein